MNIEEVSNHCANEKSMRGQEYNIRISFRIVVHLSKIATMEPLLIVLDTIDGSRRRKLTYRQIYSGILFYAFEGLKYNVIDINYLRISGIKKYNNAKTGS